MLLGGYPTARRRLGHLGFLVVGFSLPALLWPVMATLGVVPWPASSGPVGLSFGIAGAAMIAFEMLIWPRKALRRFKLGKTRSWMRWHVWVGLAVGPVGVLHSGYHWGGPLTTILMVLFIGVIASGVWGLALQQVLPQKLLDDFPDETIETQVNFVMGQHREEFQAIVTRLPLDDRDTGHLLSVELRHYLDAGDRNRFASERESAQLFTQLARQFVEFPGEIARLKVLCDDRRRYDRQARLHRWLHNWLCVHAPLSVALCVILVFHVVTALKYW